MICARRGDLAAFLEHTTVRGERVCAATLRIVGGEEATCNDCRGRAVRLWLCCGLCQTHHLTPPVCGDCAVRRADKVTP